MTDNEIVKALEYCGCAECMAILDLINRQKAEIERLEGNLKFVRGTVERMKKYDEERDIRLHARLTETARAEAIKEFAAVLVDRLDLKHEKADVYINDDYIAKIVEEMTEETKHGV